MATKDRISEQDIRNQLDDILSSRTFSRHERDRRFVKLLATTELEGRGDELNQKFIAIRIYGETGGLTEERQSTVRSAIRDLRKRLETYYKEEAADNAVVIEVGKGQYRPTFKRKVQPSRLSSAKAKIKATDDGGTAPGLVRPGGRITSLEYLVDDDAALEYEVGKLPSLWRLRDVHVRLDSDHRPYRPEVLDKWRNGLQAFLTRGGRLMLVAGQDVDDTYVENVAKAVKSAERGVKKRKRGGESVKASCFRLRRAGPLMNFALLDFERPRRTEVLFGWGRYDSESAEAVFRSDDSRLVAEFSRFYSILTQQQHSRRNVSVDELIDRLPEELSASAFSHEWRQDRLYELIKVVERGPRRQVLDIKIQTPFLIDMMQLRQPLRNLLAKKVRIGILVTDPRNRALLEARCAAREDGQDVDEARRDIIKQMRVLAALPKGVKNCKGTLEVRLSNIMPCGFVVQSRRWAVMGLLPAHCSYMEGPMVEVGRNTSVWKLLQKNWDACWRLGTRPPEDVLFE